MEKIAVYTGIFGDYDPYVEPEFGEDIDVFFLTDSYPKRVPSRAKVVILPTVLKDLTRNARLYKVMSHASPVQDYRLVVWIDGAIDAVDVDLRALVEKYTSDNDIALFRHQTIDCVYIGGNAAVLAGKEDPLVMVNHLTKLRKAGYPAAAGLGETNILIRRHNDTVRRFNELWWDEISSGSKRDQVSFNYCVNLACAKLAYINGKRQDYGFYVREHKK